MKRVIMLFGLMVLTPFLLGAGGQAPGNPLPTRLTGPVLQGTFILDPHQGPFFDPGQSLVVPGVTTTAKLAQVQILRGGRIASAFFEIDDTVPFRCGCDLRLTNLRFDGKPVNSFVPQEVLDGLIEQIGVVPPPGGVLEIVRIIRPRCLPDGSNPATDPLTGQIARPFGQPACAVPQATFPQLDPLAGHLTMEVLMQFRVPAN